MKKLLSIFLATAMLISLIPAVFADDTATEAGIKIVYDFVDENVINTNLPTDSTQTTTTYQLDPTVFTYDTTNGFWEYAEDSYEKDLIRSRGDTGVRINTTTNAFQVVPGAYSDTLTDKYWIAFKLYTPKIGTYKVDIKVNSQGYAKTAYVDAYIFEVDSVSSAGNTMKEKIIAGITEPNRIQTDKFQANNGELTQSFTKEVTLDNKEFYFVFKPTSQRTDSKDTTKIIDGAYMSLLSLTLTEGDGKKSVPMISSLTATGNQVSATAAKMSNGDTATDVTYSYAVADDDIALAEVDASTGVVKGLADGTATIIATATKDGYSSSKSIEVAVTAPAGEPEEDEPLVDEFIKEEEKEDISDSYVEATVTGLELNGNTIEATKNTDGTYNLTAPKKEEKFLYWAMGLVGNKRIVSFSETLENYVPEGNYRNYLVPVYEGDVDTSKNEFYNQDGQLIPDATESTQVSMPGYGSTSSWKKYGDTNIYVADYGKTEEQRDKVTVTVVGGTGTGTVLFGKTVICTANAADANGNPFKCWKKTFDDKTTEIVSIDKTYSFKAWENCTVTAVYEEHTPISKAMKIIIDDFTVGSENGVMAEFIGLDNAVEKGIMFGDKKIAMTTKDNQFTVIADKPGTYTGYAILKNGDNAYSLITDGSYTKSAE